MRHVLVDDAHAVGLVREIQQAQDLRFLLEQVEGAAQVVHVAGKIAHRQQIALAGDHHVLAIMVAHDLGAYIYRRLHEAGNLAPQLLHLGLQPRAHLLHCQTGVMVIEEIRGFYQLRGLVIHIREDHAVLHIAFGRDDDDQKAPLRQAHELDMLEDGAATRHHDHTHELGEVGQQIGRIGNHLLRLFRHQAGRYKIAAIHGQHGVDKQAVSPGCRHAACRCVRTDDQTHLFQVGHHIAYGGRRQFKPGCT